MQKLSNYLGQIVKNLSMHINCEVRFTGENVTLTLTKDINTYNGIPDFSKLFRRETKIGYRNPGVNSPCSPYREGNRFYFGLYGGGGREFDGSAVVNYLGRCHLATFKIG